MTDATFNLVSGGWSTTSIGCRSLKRKLSNGTVTQTYRPLSFAMSVTESYVTYDLILQSTKKILFIGEGFTLITKVINMDKHDGAIKCFQEDNPGCLIL
jgi:hypothetical protein